MTAVHDRLICRLDPATRVVVLDALVRHSPVVVVEHAYTRKLADAYFTPGTLLGVASSPSGTTDYVLLIRPHAFDHEPERRIVALSVAHLLRIRAATLYKQIGRAHV